MPEFVLAGGADAQRLFPNAQAIGRAHVFGRRALLQILNHTAAERLALQNLDLRLDIEIRMIVTGRAEGGADVVQAQEILIEALPLDGGVGLIDARLRKGIEKS